MIPPTGSFVMDLHTGLCIICGLVITLAVVMLCSVFGKKMTKLIPFIIGILAGYAVASVFTIIGNATGNEALVIVDYSAFAEAFREVSIKSFLCLPEFTFLEAFKGFGEL